MTKLRYILLSVLGTVLAAVSCTETLDREGASSDRRIRFTTAAYVPQTKADAEAFGDTLFQVSAWTKTGNQLYFKNADVTKADGCWSTSDAYCWPKTDDLYFVATHGKIGGNPWISVNDEGTVLSTGGEITVFPTQVSADTSRLLFSDKTLGLSSSPSVAITFRNALAAVTARIRIRKCDDAVIKVKGSGADTAYYYRAYDVWDSVYVKMPRKAGETDEEFDKRVQDSLSKKTTYYVVPFGFSPNATTYPTEVKLKSPINHIWNVTILYIGAIGVATKGSLSMNLEDNKWKADSVWNVPKSIEYHKDTAFLYSYIKDGESTGTLVPSNLQDYFCDFADGYSVIPQALNWSPSSTINNQKANIRVQIQDYTADFNGDGIFDYRDVYQHWVVNSTKKDTVLIENATSLTGHKEADGYTFHKWYEWDGYATGKYKKLKALHDIVAASGGSLTYSKPIDGTTAYLDYEVKSTIELSLLPKVPLYWGMNTMTTYSISIDPMTDEIGMSPKVTSWVDIGSVSTE